MSAEGRCYWLLLNYVVSTRRCYSVISRCQQSSVTLPPITVVSRGILFFYFFLLELIAGKDSPAMSADDTYYVLSICASAADTCSVLSVKVVSKGALLFCSFTVCCQESNAVVLSLNMYGQQRRNVILFLQESKL